MPWADVPGQVSVMLRQLSAPRTADHITEFGQTSRGGGDHHLGKECAGASLPGSVSRGWQGWGPQAYLARPRPAVGQVSVAGTQSSGVC